MSYSKKPDYISLDFYNHNFEMRINEKSMYIGDISAFVSATGCPFYETVVHLAYEPERNIYLVNRIDGTGSGDTTSDEMKWVIDNIELLESVCEVEMAKQAQQYIVTMEMKRNGLLAETDWLMLRHQDEKLLEVDTTLTDSQMLELSTYRQILRNMSKTYQKDDDASTITWPNKPSFL